MIDVAVEVFVVIIGLRGRIAGVSAAIEGRQVVHFAVVARAASLSMHKGPVVEAFHRPPTRGAVVVVVAHLRRREALESHRPKGLALPLTPGRRAHGFLTIAFGPP